MAELSISNTAESKNCLYTELSKAVGQMSAEDLKSWGSKSVQRIPKLAVRRAKNFGSIVSKSGKFVFKELVGVHGAFKEGELKGHFKQRSVAAIDGTISAATFIKKSTSEIGKALFDNPQKNVLAVLSIALGYMVGSGGIDGNGGIPDTDIKTLGINAHRSPITHSIIAGIIAEAAILAIADLADVVVQKIPKSNRDPFWDKLIETKNQIAINMNRGVSSGIAYHLAIDATLQPGAYHGLPISMPMEAHQTLIGLNSLIEGIDVAHKEISTGQKVVNGISGFGKNVSDQVTGKANAISNFFSKNLVEEFKKSRDRSEPTKSTVGKSKKSVAKKTKASKENKSGDTK